MNGKCEDGCQREGVIVEVRKGFVLLCDDCARDQGVLYRLTGPFEVKSAATVPEDRVAMRR